MSEDDDDDMSMEQTWENLVETFFSPQSDDEDMAEAGERLAWYFPTIDESLKDSFKNNMAGADDRFLARAMNLLAHLMSEGQEDSVEPIMGLLRFVPDLKGKLTALAESGELDPRVAPIVKQMAQLL